MANRRPTGGPSVAVKAVMAKATASRKLPHGWDYLVLIQGTDGFSVVFDGRGEPKTAVLSAVFDKRFTDRLETLSAQLGQSLYVEVIGYHGDTPLRDLATLALRHEGPAILVMQATYDEGDLNRQLARALSA